MNSGLDDLDNLLKQDPDVRQLIDIRQEITRRVIDRNVPIAAVKAASQNKDETQFRRLLGFTNSEFKYLKIRLNESRLAILDRYSEMENLVADDNKDSFRYNPLTGSRKTGQFVDKLTSYSNNYLEMEELELEYEAGSEVRCRWAPYIAGLVGCAATGPVWYWPCAFVVVCSFCSGGWVDSACGSTV
jgi:hypothetical protein